SQEPMVQAKAVDTYHTALISLLSQSRPHIHHRWKWQENEDLGGALSVCRRHIVKNERNAAAEAFISDKMIAARDPRRHSFALRIKAVGSIVSFGVSD